MNKEKSTFGRGLVYNIGLFLAHERDKYIWGNEIKGLEPIYINTLNENYIIGIWFSSSSDHLYDIEIPDNFPQALKKRIKRFQDKCLSWGHGFGIGGRQYGEPNREKVDWALGEAKSILREIDRVVIKVKSEKGEYE